MGLSSIYQKYSPQLDIDLLGVSEKEAWAGHAIHALTMDIKEGCWVRLRWVLAILYAKACNLAYYY